MEGQTDGQRERMVERRKSRDFSQWIYRGEGNHNIVIAHKQEKTVYRLAKRQSTATGIPLPGNGRVHKVSGELVRQTLQRRVEFVRHVLGPLLGPHFVHSGELVDLSPTFITDVCTNVISPAVRDLPEQDLIPGVSDPLVFPYAWCLPDSCFHGNDHNNNQAPTFAVEIKPNVMFMSRCPTASSVGGGQRDAMMTGPSLSTLRENVCRHCFTNMCKVKKGKWKKFSTSCPMDLISGDQERMKFALTELFKVPHHRLRVYKDGKTVFKYEMHDVLESSLASHFGYQTRDNKEVSCLEHFIDVIIQALLLVPNHHSKTSDSTSSSNNDISTNNSSNSRVPKNDGDPLKHSSSWSQATTTTTMTTTPSILSVTQPPPISTNIHETRNSTCRLSDFAPNKLNGDVLASESGDLQKTTNGQGDCISRPANGYTGENQEMLDSLGQNICDSHIASSRTHHAGDKGDLHGGHCQASLFSRTGESPGSASGVPQGCILDCLRSAQMFSGLTVASAQPYFTKVMEHLKGHAHLRKDSCMDGPYNTEAWSRVMRGDLDPLTSPDPDSIEYAIKKVQQFLTFLTLKSASIMITLQPLVDRQSENPPISETPPFSEGETELPVGENSLQTITDLHGNRFKVNICVLDLDPKPLEKIGKIYARDQKDFEVYMQCMSDADVWR